jgi:hypothetical protein
MHERPFTRAAGVSPPWIFKPRLQVPYAGFPRCELGASTGGLRPPALVSPCECPSTKKAIFAMHIRTFTRAAGVSPPWVWAVERGPRYAANLLQARFRSHGRLTPTALRWLRGCRWKCAFVSATMFCFPRSAHADRFWCTYTRTRFAVTFSGHRCGLKFQHPRLRQRSGCQGHVRGNEGAAWVRPLATLRRLRRASARK